MTDYALVVGIERYQTVHAASLQGPSLDALRFALWLHQAQTIPARNIILIQNKSDLWHDEMEEKYKHILEEVEASGIRVREDPSRQIIEKAWREELLAGPETAGTLWIYWSGHGVTFPPNREVVLCSDVAFKDPSYIFLAEFRDSLRSRLFQRYSRQRLIVDACTEYTKPESLNISSFRNPATWSITETPEQIELNAAPLGKVAQAEEGGSLFSRVLFNELKKAGWPDDLAAFYKALENAVRAQTPGESKLPRIRIMSPRFEAGFDNGRYAEECGKLLEMLSRCKISFDSYQPFYIRTMGRLTSDAQVLSASNLTVMVLELLQLEREAAYGDYAKGLVEFLERIRRHFADRASPIAEWLQKNVPEGARLTINKALDLEAADLVLTVVLQETALNPGGFPVAIHADLSDASFTRKIMQWDFHDLQDYVSLETELRSILNASDAQARRQKEIELRVQIFANPPLMWVPWHALQIDPDDEIDSTTFGELHSFLLRSRARLAQASKYDLSSWKAKAKALRQRRCSQIEFEQAPAWRNEEKKGVNEMLAKVDGLLFFPEILEAPSPSTEGLYKLLTAAMRRGIALASWPVIVADEQNNSKYDPDEFARNLKKLFEACDWLPQTPDHFREARKTESWARQTALFWDDDDADRFFNLLGEEPTQL